MYGIFKFYRESDDKYEFFIIPMNKISLFSELKTKLDSISVSK